MPRQMSLTAFLMPAGQHIAAWRHRNSQADADVNFAHYRELARTAERGKFDAVFIADFAGAISAANIETAKRSSHNLGFEPITLLSALAAVTDRIGLVGTVSSTFNEPFNLARKFASLDLISGGRTGWNLVTSVNQEEAFNFGLDGHVLHADRYERANEFADVVHGLWDSWREDAFPRDRASGIYFEPDGLRVLNHKGTHFAVRGPLNVPPSPQGRPVLFQSGSSEPGKTLAARSAEAVFTAHQTLKSAAVFYADLRGLMEGFGRAPDEMKIMPGVFPVVAGTQAEAEDRYDELQDLVHPEIGVALLSQLVGYDLSPLPLDGPLPEIPETNGNKSRQRLLMEIAADDRLSIRELYLRIAGARGHWTVVGSVRQVADALEEWFTGGAADGFNVMPPLLPSSLDDIVTLLVPELQRRGLFRHDYSGGTLRSHLGLEPPRPARRSGQSSPPTRRDRVPLPHQGHVR